MIWPSQYTIAIQIKSDTSSTSRLLGKIHRTMFFLDCQKMLCRSFTDECIKLRDMRGHWVETHVDSRFGSKMQRRAYAGAAREDPFVSSMPDGLFSNNAVLHARQRTNSLHITSGASQKKFYRHDKVWMTRLTSPEARRAIFANNREFKAYNILHDLMNGKRKGFQPPVTEIKAKVSD